MSHSAPVSPPLGTVHVEVRRVDRNQAIVTVNGVDYKFTIFRTRAGAEQDVTSEHDWEAIAKQATEIALNLTGKRAVDKASVVLTGIPEDPTTIVPTARPVQLLEAEVEFKEDRTGHTARTRFEGDRIPRDAQLKVRQNLDQIGQEYASIRPLSSSRVTSHEPGEVVIQDPKVDICKDRPKAIVQGPSLDGSGPVVDQPGLDYALADQLSKMPNSGRALLNGISVQQNATALRHDYALHVVAPGKGYDTDPVKFNEILASLRKASTDDTAKLETSRGAIGLPDQISTPDLATLLGPAKSFDNLSSTEKQKLIKLYAKYVDNGGKVLGDSFLRAFQEVYSTGDRPPNFQIVVIKEDGTSKHYPEGDDTIALKRCAFIYLGNDGRYQSYSRASRATAPILKDLNSDETISSRTTTVRRTPPPFVPSVPLRPVSGNGSCVELSVAYQILKTPSVDPTNEQLVIQGEALRGAVAAQLRQPTHDADLAFVGSLVHSVGEIPAFKQNNRELLKLDNGSGALLRPILDQGPFDEIRRILQKHADSPPLIPDEIRTLREYYTTYITEQHADGKMKNYLDQAFLYLLPKVNSEYKVAVISGNRITATFPEEAELNFNDWKFIHLDTRDSANPHYDPVNKTAVGAQDAIEEMIIIKETQRKERVLDGFMQRLAASEDLTPNGDPNAIRRALFEELRVQHPKAYKAISQLAWKKEHDAWESSDRSMTEPGHEPNLPRPGTPALASEPDRDYTGANFGDWRLASWSPDELKAALKTFPRDEIIRLMSQSGF
ncbi:MAG: hypothetical protein JSS60_04345 [Verrucomicrobia bacterium]|nr:hypothetical protein [Verrucomicrobiota bacterium]